jgi:hypothetical protein
MLMLPIFRQELAIQKHIAISSKYSFKSMTANSNAPTAPGVLSLPAYVQQQQQPMDLIKIPQPPLVPSSSSLPSTTSGSDGDCDALAPAANQQ